MIKAPESYKGFNITFQVTEDCVLACKYCYELDKKPGDLPIEYATKFIDIILEDPDPINVIGTDTEWILNQGLILDFIGGDPLMKPELCKQILQYFMYRSTELNHRWAKQWRASMSTNGVLFESPGVKEFLTEFKQNISIGVSIDGCPEIHDKNRIFKNGRGSIESIMKNWDWFKSIFPEDATKTKATCNKDSIPYLFKSVKFLYEKLGITNILMNFVFEDMGLEEADYIELENQLSIIVPYILERKDKIYFSMLSKEFGCGKPTEQEHLTKGWCGSGAMPTVTINGKIYPCFRFTPNTMSDRSYDFNVGDIWSGLNHKERFEIVRNQTREKISTPECLSCNIESTCAWCIGGAYSEKGEFYRQTNLCRVKKITSKWADIYWEQYNKELTI